MPFLENLNIWNLMSVPASILAIVIHEIAHGVVAYWLGDNTAKENNRLSLNPIRHVDPIGLLLLIVVGFGWAKPVPVNPSQFKKPRRDMALVALAGPFSNFLLTFLCILGARAMLDINSAATEWIFAFLVYTGIRSAGLGVFNLIPIPPLDGSKILGSFLPERIYYPILRYERYGIFFLLLLSFFPRITAQFGLTMQNPIVYPINGVAEAAFSFAGLHKPMTYILDYVREVYGSNDIQMLDIILFREPIALIEDLRTLMSLFSL